MDCVYLHLAGGRYLGGAVVAGLRMDCSLCYLFDGRPELFMVIRALFRTRSGPAAAAGDDYVPETLFLLDCLTVVVAVDGLVEWFADHVTVLQVPLSRLFSGMPEYTYFGGC